MVNLTSALANSLQGMQRASASVEQSARRLATGTLGSGVPTSGPPGDIVDLSAEMVALSAAKNAFAANANVARAADEMTQSIVNLLA